MYDADYINCDLPETARFHWALVKLLFSILTNAYNKNRSLKTMSEFGNRIS